MNHAIDLDAFVRETGDAIIAANQDGVIVFWNPAAEAMFGFTAQDAVGNSLDLIIPERLRRRHWDAFRRTMSTGKTKYGKEVLRVPAIHKDGHKLSIAFTIAILRSPNNGIESIVAIVRDETERWDEERELRRRLEKADGRTAASE
ncbi:MAG: PAS domain S-box protein [Planctomycetaceae bacterium]|nr:PAS domain-containing protein [Planctomycetales bacterium]MCB9922279.1 PAS domain S-box protein [Planctomycetaceae bacterium]